MLYFATHALKPPKPMFQAFFFKYVVFNVTIFHYFGSIEFVMTWIHFDLNLVILFFGFLLLGFEKVKPLRKNLI